MGCPTTARQRLIALHDSDRIMRIVIATLMNFSNVVHVSLTVEQAFNLNNTFIGV